MIVDSKMQNAAALDLAIRRRKKCLLYPDANHREKYDLFMTLLLLITCILSPYTIAFLTEEDVGMRIFSDVIDAIFFIDILVIFNTATYDENMKIIVDRKIITKNYLTGWFTVDLLAIIPFDYILRSQNDMSSMLRVARVGKLYKLVKLTKLIRVLKMVKEKSKFV